MMKRSDRYLGIGIVGFGLLMLAIIFHFEMESPQASKPISKTDLPEMEIVENEVANDVEKASARGAHLFKKRVREMTDPRNIAKSKEAWRRKENRRIFEEARAEVEAETGIKLFDFDRRPSFEDQMNWTPEEYITHGKKEIEDGRLFDEAMRLLFTKLCERSPYTSEQEKQEEFEALARLKATGERIDRISLTNIAKLEIWYSEMSDEEWAKWNRDRVNRMKEMKALREKMPFLE